MKRSWRGAGGRERSTRRLLTRADDEWPGRPLTGLETDLGQRGSCSAPRTLWVEGTGRLADATVRAVAIVGSRDATSYGVRAATRLARGLADRGWTVITGDGYGVGRAAQRGALSLGGSTVAVLPSGLAFPVPRGHSILFRRIARRGGLLVSEQPPDARPDRCGRAGRNRLLAALAYGTVAVEIPGAPGQDAPERWTVRLGRPLMAVPGPITSAESAGCHQMIQRGAAELVTSAEDVLAVLDRYRLPGR